jgi:serine/threonine protein kinase/lipoprotein NlpI
MSTDHETTDGSKDGPAALDLVRQVDQLCNRFESAWKTGQRPKLQDCMVDLGPVARDAALRELIPIDVHYRRRAGEEPQADDYLLDFPLLDRKWLDAVIASERPGEQSSTIAYRPVVPQVRGGKYTIKRLLARGGMGEIWLADDVEIGREVALKKIRHDRVRQSERFLAEAQITGQLEHPGIVPVHELAQGDDGHPFYVMKFVRGRPLKDVIDDFHTHAGGADRAPAHFGQGSGRRDGDTTTVSRSREVERLRLLEIFVDLCHTVAYAHSRGVLHRDLKPDNVMVGEFGETQVVDWGLAKVMHQSDLPGGGSYVHSTYAEYSGETQAGSVLGAPAYMSPEMAEGHSDQVDQRTDIYLLGSTLYYILTGQAPRRGRSHDEIVELARTVPPVPPRQLDAAVPRALDAICQKAMARRKQDRYATAMELATDTQNFIAGEPVSAYRESVPERAWRWANRHRQQVAWSAAALALLAVTAVAGAKIQHAQEAFRHATARAEEERTEKELSQAREAARQELAEFRRLADEVQFYAASRDAVAERAPYFEPEQALAKGREALGIVDKWGHDPQGIPLPPDEISREVLKGEIYDLLVLLAQTAAGREQTRDQAMAWLERASSLRVPSRIYYALQAECLRSAGDERAAADAQVRADDPSTPITAQDHFLLGERFRNQSSPDPTLSYRLGEPNEQLDAAVKQYRLASEQDASHFWSHLQLGRCLFALGRRTEAVGSLSTAIALRPESPWGYAVRSLIHAMDRRFDDALATADEALRKRPGFRPAMLNRGFAHWQEGRTSEALADFAAVLEPPRDQRLIEAAYYRARLYLAEKKYPEALADLELVLQENPRFHAAHLSRAHANFGQGDVAAGVAALNDFLSSRAGFDPKSAEASAERGSLLRRLRPGWALLTDANDATAKQTMRELDDAVRRRMQTARLFNDRGLLFDSAKQYQRAESEYSKGLKLDPNDVNLRNNRGWVYIELNQFDNGRDDFAIAAQSEPKSPREFIARAEAHTGLGLSHALLGNSIDAIYEAGRAWMFLEQGAEHYIVWHNIACIYGEVSKASNDQKYNKYDEQALEFLGRAVKTGGPLAQARIMREERFLPEWLRENEKYQRLLAPTPQK